MSRKAFITGVTGQDGSYLAELLLEKNYEVHGLTRRSSRFDRADQDRLVKSRKHEDFHLHTGNVLDQARLFQILKSIEPEEIYHLAAQSDVSVSFEEPAYTGNVNAMGTVHLLECVRNLSLDARIYQASTSEMYGKADVSPQNESTAFQPCSPYGSSKLYAYSITHNYRDAYNTWVANGILFNHESPRRTPAFVTRKISRAVARIEKGQQDVIRIGNLEAERDWGYAPDYVRGMWMILQHTEPEDFVLATGNTHSVRTFLEKSFDVVGKSIEWTGSGIDEAGYDSENGKKLVSVDPDLFRPHDVETLVGDATKANERLGWSPNLEFDEIVETMVLADIDRIDT